MADLDTEFETRSPMGYAITTTLRAIIAGGAASVRTALGLGTAAITAATAYATSTQGGKADTALQPVVSGSGIHAGGFAKHKVVAGSTAGAFTCTGIKVGDELDEVIYYVGAGTAVTNVTDLTAEFTITGTDTINNGSATNSSGGVLLVRWTKLTA